jgi:hypothetical protein
MNMPYDFKWFYWELYIVTVSLANYTSSVADAYLNNVSQQASRYISVNILNIVTP